MEQPIAICDNEGNVPLISMATTDWTGWCGLNVDASRVPINAELFVNYSMKDRDEATEPITESGRYMTMDWAAEPDWYRPGEHWRGWLPIKDYEGQLPCAEFLDLDEKAPSIRSARGQWFVGANYSATLESRVGQLEDLVDSCIESDLGRSGFIRPPPFDKKGFEVNLFDSEQELQRAVMAVRRAIADRIGWLYWFDAFVPQPLLREKLPASVLRRLIFETRTEYRKRGYLLRPADSWSEINIPLWLSHKVPIWYSWGFEERLMPQLCRLNPKIVAGDASEGRVALYDVEDDQDLESTIETCRNTDDFFQPKVGGTLNHQLSYEIDAVFFIIDFHMWGRRPLPTDIDSSAYSERFFFTTEEPDNPQDGPRVIFWRWKKKTSASGNSHHIRIRPNGEFDEAFIREAFKDQYAPRKGRRFNEYDGKPMIADEDVNMDEATEVFLDHRRETASPTTDTSEEGSVGNNSESGKDDSEVEGTSWSLFTRLGIRRPASPENNRPFSTVANVTAWCLAGTEDRDGSLAERGRSLRQFRRNRSSRSRSPQQGSTQAMITTTGSRRPLLAHVPPGERPLTLFRRKLSDIGHIISHDERQEPLPYDLWWNHKLLEYGYVIILDRRSEVRLRYFANDPKYEIRHPGRLFIRAIEQRIAFTIAIREEDVPRFAPRDFAQAERIYGKHVYGPNHTEPPYEFQTSIAFVTAYMTRVSELLKRPHAGSLIGLGGAVSWLAQKWGGYEIIAKFMRGPSVQTTVFRKGASDIGEPRPRGLLWDEVLGGDMDVLFGLVRDASSGTNSWVFPPPDILDEFCDNWTGEWNWVLESIFTFLTNEMSKTPPTVVPRSRGAWKRWLKTYNGGKYKPLNKLTDDHVNDIMKGIALAELPRTWNFFPISSIFFPEATV